MMRNLKNCSPRGEAAYSSRVTVLGLGLLMILLQTYCVSQVSYEGQTVSSVGVIADPRLDVDKYLPLIAQEAGKPYSHADVDSSSAALYNAGNSTTA